MDLQDPRALAFEEALTTCIDGLGGPAAILSYLPWLQYVVPDKWLGLDKMNASLELVYDYLQEVIQEHKDAYHKNNQHVDFIDMFLHEMYRQRDNPQTSFTGKLTIA